MQTSKNHELIELQLVTDLATLTLTDTRVDWLRLIEIITTNMPAEQDNVIIINLTDGSSSNEPKSIEIQTSKNHELIELQLVTDLVRLTVTDTRIGWLRLLEILTVIILAEQDNAIIINLTARSSPNEPISSSQKIPQRRLGKGNASRMCDPGARHLRR